jgi:hypothetical protein
MTNMVKEAANLVVSSSAIIANHDMMSVVAIGAAVSVSRARILVSLVSSMDEDMPSKGGEKKGGSFATWRPQQRHNCGHHAYQAQQGRTGRASYAWCGGAAFVFCVSQLAATVFRSRQTAPPPQSSPDLHDAEMDNVEPEVVDDVDTRWIAGSFCSRVDALEILWFTSAERRVAKEYGSSTMFRRSGAT